MMHAAFSPNGCSVVIAQGFPCQPQVKIWEVDRKVCTLSFAASVAQVEFSPDGHFLLTASGGDSRECAVQIWNVHTGDCTMTFGGPFRPPVVRWDQYGDEHE